ncbi:MAG: hypothetical protein ACRDRO_19580 [Pseudonocardiaceae bacterium]
MSRWPAMIWAMCGGRPDMMASVMSMRRKSCGVKINGPPVSGSVRVLSARAVLRAFADRV